MTFLQNEFFPKKKNPLSVILERSAEDIAELNSSRESRQDFPDIEKWNKSSRGSLNSRPPRLDFSDSEFCSSDEAMDMLAQDEAERLQFVNSQAESFFDKENSFPSRLNRTNKANDESIGTYFYTRSSHPMQEKELNSSRFQKTFEGTEWLENSGICQPKPCDTSTPKPNHISANVTPVLDIHGPSAMKYDLQDEPLPESHGSYRNSSTYMNMNKSSIAQLLHESNGSISSMANFFNRPEANGMGKDAILSHILEYCRAKSIIDTNSMIETSLLDTSSFSNFKENLEQDSESSASSKNTSTAHGSSTDTIIPHISPSRQSPRDAAIRNSISSATAPLSEDPKPNVFNGVNQNQFSVNGVPFIIQIQCSCYHGLHQSEYKSTSNQNCNKPTPSSSTASLQQQPLETVSSLLKRAKSQSSKNIAERPGEASEMSISMDSTQYSPEVPNIKVDKALVGFNNTQVGSLKMSTVTIHNMSSFDIFLRCGVQRSHDQCFWNFSKQKTPNRRLDVRFIIPSHDNKTVTLAFQPNREGQVLGTYVLKFNRENGVDDNEVVYRTEIQLTGFGVPPRCSRETTN